MKRLILFCVLVGVMLGTAVPPRPAAPPVSRPAPALREQATFDSGAVLQPQKKPPAVVVIRAPEPPAPPPFVPLSERAAPPPDGPVKILVSLRQQMAFVYRAGALVATSPVSTGKRGHETPTGTFPIMEKQVHHRSNRYSNAPMPYMQRLTAYGIALHAGHVPGYPASHGCIRLPWGFARKLYGMTGYGTTVTVTRGRVRREA